MKARKGSAVSVLSVLGAAALALSLLTAGESARAGGGTFAGPGPYCRHIEDATYLVNYESLRWLRGEVRQRYEHAVDVATDPETVYTASPLHVWASEAKAACARAIGYLRKRWKWNKRPNYVTLQKCECFYDRMTRYLDR